MRIRPERAKGRLPRRGLPGERAAALPRSWWLQEALDDDGRTPPLTDRITADVCIVGGGFTGLWTALRIKELAPDTDVVIIEADVCGGGASGRNGGFAMTLYHHFMLLERLCGATEALRLARASVDALDAIGEFCDANGIDAGYRRHGWLWTASNRTQLGAWNATIEALERLDASPFQRLAPAEVAERSASRRNVAGVFEPGLASVQPAALARGIRRVALERGVKIHERSPMIELVRDATPVVRTPHGSVTGSRVVLALNAWASHLRELQGRFLTLAGDMVVTERIPERLDEIGLDTCVLISDSRLLLHYFHRTADGRLSFGKGGGGFAFGNKVGSKFEGPSPRADGAVRSLRWFYPELSSARIEASWTGGIDRSFDGLPFFSRLGRSDIIAAAGYSGNGVGPSLIGGRILASMVLDRVDEWSSSSLVRQPPGRPLPPEPIRWIGGRMVKASVARKERADDEGRRPAFFDRVLPKLVPPGIVPTDGADEIAEPDR